MPKCSIVPKPGDSRCYFCWKREKTPYDTEDGVQLFSVFIVCPHPSFANSPRIRTSCADCLPKIKLVTEEPGIDWKKHKVSGSGLNTVYEFPVSEPWRLND